MSRTTPVNLLRRWWDRLRRTSPSSQGPYLDLDRPLGRPRLPATDAASRDEILTPLLIPAPFGRAGSTGVMELLGSSPQVAFERVYPYEERYLTYLVHWAQMLGRSQPVERSWHPGVLFEEKLDHLKPFPMPGLGLPRTCPERGSFWERCLAAAWKEFSPFAAINQRLLTEADAPVRYYAEKVPEWCFKAVSRILPVKTIYLLRDPRDVWLSGVAFDKKRRMKLFGPRKNQSRQAHIEELAQRWKGRLQTILRVFQAGNRGSEYVIRYEEFITNLAGEADRLGRWLGLRLTPAVPTAVTENHAHMTSTDFASSAGRWKRELRSDLNELFVKHLETELRDLGYDLR